MKKNKDNNEGIIGVEGGAGEGFCNNCGRPVVLVDVVGKGLVAIHGILTSEEQDIRNARGCPYSGIGGEFGDAEGAAAIWEER